jgi:hypothetical protein
MVRFSANRKLGPYLAGLAALLGLHLAAQMPASDPNRSLDWHWWVNQPQTIYFCPIGATPQRLSYISLPWFLPSHAVYESDPTKLDAFPQDGWMLVSRDFGTASRAPVWPYFLLYNRFRGVLRVFMYNPLSTMSIPPNKATLRWRDPSPDISVALFSFTNENGRCFLEDHPAQDGGVTFGNTTPPGCWAWWDFIVAGYDPASSSALNSALTLEVVPIDSSKVQFLSTGNWNLTQILNTMPPTSSLDATGTLEMALNLGPDFYRTPLAFQEKAKEWLNDPSNSSRWWYQPLRDLAPLAIGSLEPLAAKLAGVVTQFIGGGRAGSWEPLNFTGTLKLNTTGTIELVGGELGNTPGFYLNPKSGDWLPGEMHALQSIPWGVFSIQSKPVLEVCKLIGHDDMGRARVNGYMVQIQSSPAVLTNSATGMSLLATEVCYSSDDAQPTAFISLDQAASGQLFFQQLPRSLTYRLRFQAPTSQVADSIRIFQKSVPVTIVYGANIPDD